MNLILGMIGIFEIAFVAFVVGFHYGERGALDRMKRLNEKQTFHRPV